MTRKPYDKASLKAFPAEATKLLKCGGMTAEQIAAETGFQKKSVYRLMNKMSADGKVDCTKEGNRFPTVYTLRNCDQVSIDSPRRKLSDSETARISECMAFARSLPRDPFAHMVAGLA